MLLFTLLVFVYLITCSAMVQPVAHPASFHEGRRALKSNHLIRAVKLFQQSTKESPTFSGSWMGLGMTYVKLGQSREASYAFYEATKLNPNDASAAHNLATSLADFGELRITRNEILSSTYYYQKSFFLKLSKQLNGIPCKNHDGWVVDTYFQRNSVGDTISTMNRGVQSTHSFKKKSPQTSSLLTSSVIKLLNITLIDTLMLHLPSCTLFTGRHQWLRTIPRSLGSILFDINSNKKIPMTYLSSSKDNVSHNVLSLLQSTKGSNLYHWMAESVVRLVVWIENRGLMNAVDGTETTILVPSSNTLIDETLSLLGLKEETKIRILHHQNGQNYFIESLHWIDWSEKLNTENPLRSVNSNRRNVHPISWVTPISPSRPPTYIYYAPLNDIQLTSTYIQSKLCEIDCQIGSIDLPKQQIIQVVWVSRSGAKNRHILNEKDIIQDITMDKEIIQKPLALSIHNGTKTLKKQIKMFQLANIIIGPHGAGMTFIMYAKASVIMFPLISETSHQDGYYHHLFKTIHDSEATSKDESDEQQCKNNNEEASCTFSRKLQFISPIELALLRTKNTTFNDSQVKSILDILQKNIVNK
jgi:hypothetical protein